MYSQTAIVQFMRIKRADSSSLLTVLPHAEVMFARFNDDAAVLEMILPIAYTVGGRQNPVLAEYAAAAEKSLSRFVQARQIRKSARLGVPTAHHSTSPG